MKVAKAAVTILFVVGGFSSTCVACLPIPEPSRPPGLHEEIVKAYEIQVASDREHAMEKLLRSYLANDSREIVFQTLEYLSRNSRWIDLRPFDHLVSSISPIFAFESSVAASVFDKNLLRRESLDYRLRVYRAALIDGEVELRHGSTFDRDDAVRSIALAGLSDLMPLVEQHFAETRLATQDGITFPDFYRTYEPYLGATNPEGAAILAANRLSNLNERDKQVFRDRMNNLEDFQENTLRILDYVCAENPYTGATSPGCGFAFKIYAIQECLWLESELAQTRTGELPSTPSPCGSHPVFWLGRLERYPVKDGGSFKQNFNETAWCGFTE